MTNFMIPIRGHIAVRRVVIADLRIDFKPAKTGPNGLSDVIVLLDLITPFGGRHFITNGTLTRYDIAIDLWGGSVDQVLVLSKRSQRTVFIPTAMVVPKLYTWGLRGPTGLSHIQRSTNLPVNSPYVSNGE
jgi:hypothetical protein